MIVPAMSFNFAIIEQRWGKQYLTKRSKLRSRLGTPLPGGFAKESALLKMDELTFVPVQKSEKSAEGNK